MTFGEMQLRETLLKALAEKNYINPTPIQEKSIPVLVEEPRDIIGMAKTGTGKTLAFSLPILHHLDVQNTDIEALILCPTRELAQQIENEIAWASENIGRNIVTAVFGGAPIERQIYALRQGVKIVVGTPGRTLDLLKRNVLNVDQIKWLVLDEADEMLKMGFKDDMDAILEYVSEDRHNLLYSATLNNEIRGMIDRYMNDPTIIQDGTRNESTSLIEHHVFKVNRRNRDAGLVRIIDFYPEFFGLIFCRTKSETEEIARMLVHHGHRADFLNGDLAQNQRDKVMQKFRNGILKILVATDVAARGIDISDLTHVVNYKLPDESEVYVHRSGRTGRAGKTGISIVLADKKDMMKVYQIERFAKIKFLEQKFPTGKLLINKYFDRFIDKYSASEDEGQSEFELSQHFVSAFEDVSKEELLKMFVFHKIGRKIKSFKNLEDLNVSDKYSDYNEDNQRNRRGSYDRDNSNSRYDQRRGNSNSESGYVGFEIKMGRRDQMNPKKLLQIINDATRSSNISVGKIDIFNEKTYFEVRQSFAQKIEDSFQAGQHKLPHLERKRNYNDNFRAGNNRDYNQSNNRVKRNKANLFH